jgi:hypothetical protein
MSDTKLHSVAIKAVTEETSVFETRPVTLSSYSVPINETHAMLNDDKRILGAQNRKQCGCFHSTGPLTIVVAADRLIRRKAIIAAVIATHPYSSSITQTGSGPHGRPSARKCHMM